MSIRVDLNNETENLIRDGYREKHKRNLNEDAHALRYDSIEEYIKLGRKVQRRRSRNDFFEKWGGVLFWAVVICGFVGWSTYNNHQKSQVSNDSSSYDEVRSPSKSGITYQSSCPMTTCSDGACSGSTGRGTCSHHGGIR